MDIIKRYVFRYKSLLIWSLVLATINQVFSLFDPQVVRILIDRYATRVDAYTANEFIRGILLWGSLLVGTAFVSRTAKAFQDYFVNVLTERVGAKLYADAVTHVFNLPYRAFEDQRSGSILLTLQKARDSAKMFISTAITTLYLPLISIVFVIGYAFIVHWSIAVLFLALMPVVAITTILLSRRIKAAQEKVVRETADLSGSTTETLRNVGLVKSLGLEEQEVGRLNTVNDQVVALELKKVVLVRTLTFIQGTLVNAVRVSIYLVSIYLIFKGYISFGEFIVFTYYTFYVFNPLYNLSDLVSRYQETRAANAELEKILSLKIESGRAEGMSLKRIETVDFKGVTFSHTEEAAPAVSGISFQLERGGTIAFVGPSGSGKSTIMKLLVGLYEPDLGQILINAKERSQVNLDSFRQKIGFVPQETELFAGTIRENLHFVEPEASEEDMLLVLKQAQVLHILERGSREHGQGLDTKIGEAGIKLSGGERQRLAIARALLRNPDLIIFDEATSALDSLTEHEIIETIKTIRVERPEVMMVMVAHRLSTIQHADTIYVMRGGKIAETGTHRGLLQAHGLYHSLWQGQTEA